MTEKPIVTITGISGYLGAQVCLHFLKDGRYKVRGTVRSKTNKAKIEPLKMAFKEYFEQLELVEADLLDEQSLIKAIKGSTYVVHTASPFPLKLPKNENDLIDPSVNGTLAVMKGCSHAKVKRVVVTSSVASMQSKLKDHFTPNDWSDLKNDKAYQKSKHLAEKAAWDYLAALPDQEKFELAVINPGLIFGPNLNSAQFSSGDAIKKIMLGAFPLVPKMSMPMVDVRDCATAHLRALTVKEAAGHRFILAENTHSLNEIALELHKGFSQYGYPIPTKPMPYFILWIASFFDADAVPVLDLWDLKQTFDNSKTREILGIDFIPMKKSINDMAQTLIETGYVPNYIKNPNTSPSLWTKLILLNLTVPVIWYSLKKKYRNLAKL